MQSAEDTCREREIGRSGGSRGVQQVHGTLQQIQGPQSQTLNIQLHSASDPQEMRCSLPSDWPRCFIFGFFLVSTKPKVFLP